MFNSDNHFEEQEGFVLVSEEQIDYDSEKKFAEYRLVYRRESDGKFFSVTYQDWGTSNTEFLNDVKEVFPKTKTITYYE